MVALEFLTQADLEILQPRRKKKRAYVTTYARKQSSVCACTSRICTYTMYANWRALLVLPTCAKVRRFWNGHCKNSLNLPDSYTKWLLNFFQK